MSNSGSEHHLPQAGASAPSPDSVGTSAEGLTPQAVLASAIEQMAEGMVVVDVRGRMLVTNRAAREMVGRRSVGQAVADPNLAEWWGHFEAFDLSGNPIPQHQMPLARALAAETVENFELTLRRADGETLSVITSAVPVRDYKNRIVGAVAAFRDVTLRKQLESQLADQRRRAEEAAQHKLRVLTALARDVRNPLNSVVILSHLLRRNMHHRLTSDALQCLEGMEDGIKRTLNLVQDLLNLSRLEAGIQQVEITVFPLHSLIEECAEQVRREATDKSLFLLCQTETLDGASVRSDRNKLRQVLGCLLANAVQYSEDGGISVRARREAGKIFIDIQDTGRGIAPEDLERIFDEYSRVGKNVDRDAARGTGLSLAVARRSARLLGGDVTCTSTIGRGSVFSLILPEGGLPESSTPAEAAAAPAPPPPGPPAPPSAPSAEGYEEGET